MNAKKKGQCNMNRDTEIITHIKRYCDEITMAVNHFGDDKNVFMNDPVYRNAVAMPIQQIGELTKHLTEEFTERYTEIPWKLIKGMRTWFAHQYLIMDTDVIWEVVDENIPELNAFCLKFLNEKEN